MNKYNDYFAELRIGDVPIKLKGKKTSFLN